MTPDRESDADDRVFDVGRLDEHLTTDVARERQELRQVLGFPEPVETSESIPAAAETSPEEEWVPATAVAPDAPAGDRLDQLSQRVDAVAAMVEQLCDRVTQS